MTAKPTLSHVHAHTLLALFRRMGADDDPVDLATFEPTGDEWEALGDWFMTVLLRSEADPDYRRRFYDLLVEVVPNDVETVQ